MKICFSAWGYLEKPDDSHVIETPDGLRGERYLVIDEMLARGHDVFWVQKRRETVPYPGVTYTDDIPDCDVIFFEWRWQILGKSMGESAPKENDWTRQCQLLDEYSKRGTPMIAQDTDSKIKPEDEIRWPSLIICEPALSMCTQTRKRHQMHFACDFKKLHSLSEKSHTYIYIGNNYDRSAQFMKYYSVPALELRRKGIQTVVHGNWLNRSPERESPEAVLRRHPSIAFNPRLSYRDSMKTLSNAICTTTITKDRYSQYGYVTMRTFEAIQCDVPSLIPEEHSSLKSLGLGRYIARNDRDVVKFVREMQNMSIDDRKDIVDRQCEALHRLGDFSPQTKVDMIEAAARGELK